MAVSGKKVSQARRRAKPSPAGNLGGGETESQAQARKLREWEKRRANPTLGDKARRVFNLMRRKKKKKPTRVTLKKTNA